MKKNTWKRFWAYTTSAAMAGAMAIAPVIGTVSHPVVTMATSAAAVPGTSGEQRDVKDLKGTITVKGITEEEGVTVGCARAVLSENSAYIGRIAVKKNLRGRHIGLQICRFVIDYCEEQGCKYIWLNAQVQAQGFYEKLGFKSEGEPFMEAGIEHIKMSMEI